MAERKIGVRIVAENFTQAAFASFNEKLNQLGQSASKFNGALDGAAKSTDRAGQAASRAHGHMSGFNSIINQVIMSAQGWLMVMTLMRGMDALISGLGEVIVGFNAKLEQSSIAWETMLGSADAAKGMLYEIQQFAVRTPFEFKDVEDGTRRLMAMSVPLKQIFPLMKSIGNATSALGLGKPGLDRIILAIGQIGSKGKVMSQEMNQLAEAGIPAWAILAKAMGKTRAAVMALAEDGTIAAETFINAFMEYSQTKWGDMMDKQAKTLIGSLSNMKDAILLIGSAASKPIFDRMAAGVKGLSEQMISPQALVFGAQVAAAMEVALSAVETGMKGIGDAVIGGFHYAFGTASNEVLIMAGLFMASGPLFFALSFSYKVIVGLGVAFRTMKLKALAEILIIWRAAYELANLFKSISNFLATGQFGVPADQYETWGDQVEGVMKGVYSLVETGVEDINGALKGMGVDIPGEKGLLDTWEKMQKAWTAAPGSLAESQKKYKDALDALMKKSGDWQQETTTDLKKIKDAWKSMADDAKDRVDALKKKIDDLKQAVKDWADTPLRGEKAFDDRIFAIQQQIKKFELQKINLQLSNAPKRQLEYIDKKIEQLRLKSDKLSHESDIRFDKQKRDLKQLAEGKKEEPYAVLVKNIREAKVQLAELEPKFKMETKIWEELEKKVKDYTRAIKENTDAVITNAKTAGVYTQPGGNPLPKGSHDLPLPREADMPTFRLPPANGGVHFPGGGPQIDGNLVNIETMNIGDEGDENRLVQKMVNAWDKVSSSGTRYPLGISRGV